MRSWFDTQTLKINSDRPPSWVIIESWVIIPDSVATFRGTYFEDILWFNNIFEQFLTGATLVKILGKTHNGGLLELELVENFEFFIFFLSICTIIYYWKDNSMLIILMDGFRCKNDFLSIINVLILAKM